MTVSTLPSPELAAVPTAGTPEWIRERPFEAIPRTLFLTGGVDGCLLWRVWWTCAQLSSRGFIADYVRYQDLNDLYPLVATGRYNTLVTPRFVWITHEQADQFADKIRKDNLCWIYEADDDLWSPEVVPRQVALYPIGHPKGDAEQFEWERQERLRVVQRVDGMTVSSNGLGVVVSRYTDAPIHVVPNAIDVAWFRNVLRSSARVTEPVTIGWSGGQRNDDDLEPVGKAWALVAARHPDVHFAIHGYPSKALTWGVPPERLTYLPWSNIEDYPRALVNIDIGCCSVSGDPWNRSKTPIKWFEMSLAGAPCVVSPQLYGDVVVDGYDGLVAETPAEWAAQLGRLITDRQLGAGINENAQRSIESLHSMQMNWWRWIAAWSDVLTGRGNSRA